LPGSLEGGDGRALVQRILNFLAVVAVLAVVGLTPFQTIYDDGIWPLSVSIQSASGSPLVAATCEVFDSGDSARYSFENALPAEPGIYATVAELFRGEPIVVHVPTAETTRGSLFWKWKRFFQYNALVVVVRYSDGRRKAVLVEIPDLRQTRTIAVTVP
jgi:hypothetical protein